MVIVLIELAVYQIEDRHLHHTLVEVCCPVFDDLDSYNFLCLQILTLHNLPESALTKNVKDEVAILMPCLLRAKYVVDIKNVIAIVVVEAIVLSALAWFGEYSARIS